MGKAEENKKLKRTALLSHAFSLFINNGIPNTSISDITKHAGVGKGTFYFYFKDKDDLIQKLIAQKGAQLFSNSVSELEKQPDYDDLSVEDTMIFIINSLIEQLINDSKLLYFLNKNLTYGFIQKAVSGDNFHTEEFDFLPRYYELIKKDGSKWKEPLLMLYTIIELVSSTCHTIILYDDPVDYEHYKPYLFQCVRNIMAVFKE